MAKANKKDRSGGTVVFFLALAAVIYFAVNSDNSSVDTSALEKVLMSGPRNEYIDAWHEVAVEQMREHKIPASIILAQGILESGHGKSKLSVEACNHFGIKCGGNWDGEYILVDDDKKGERFRKYKNARESFADHSTFLLGPRYKKLFYLEPTDYTNWAKGLKGAGYATDPNYASKLIRVIEKYQLNRFDKFYR